MRAGWQRVNQTLRQLPRVFANRFSQHHRQIAGEIAVAGVFGTGHLNVSADVSWQDLPGLERGNGLRKECLNFVFHNKNLLGVRGGF